MAEHRLAVEGDYVSAQDSLDPDTAREFEELIDSMRETESADAWITVMRIPLDAMGNALPNTKGASQLFAEVMGTSTIQDLVERVRRDYIRPGENSITIRIIGKQQGKSGLKFNKVIRVERPNKPAGAENKEGMADIARVVMEMQRASDERLERALQSMSTRIVPATPAADPIDQMTKMMTAMGGMMGAMMAGRPAGAPAGGGSATNELLGLVTVLQKIGVVGGGPIEEKEEGLSDILKAVAGPALNFFAAQKQNENIRLAQGSRVTRRLASPAPINPPTSTETAADPIDTTHSAGQSATTNNAGQPATVKEPSMELQKLNAALNTVLDLADKGRKPADVAKLVLNSIPEDEDSAFYDQVSDDDFVSNCALLNDRVTAHRAWFDQLRVEILALFSPDETAMSAAETKDA